MCKKFIAIFAGLRCQVKFYFGACLLKFWRTLENKDWVVMTPDCDPRSGQGGIWPGSSSRLGRLINHQAEEGDKQGSKW